MSIGNLRDFISAMGFSITSLYIYAKSLNISDSISIHRRIIMVICCVFWALLRAFAPAWMPMLMIRPITCVAFIIIIRILTKTKFEAVVSAYLFSYGISYSILSLVTGIIAVASAPFMISRNAGGTVYDGNDLIILLLVVIVIVVQFRLSYLLFKVKRFRNGFPFLFEKNAVIIALVVSAVTLILVSIVIAPEEVFENSIYLLLGKRQISSVL